ncbi:MAG TPA: hypothetical protein VFH73_24640 [Polyangia bacterium]|jgi:hypothetical protein|nr:hypothetical protein [Polyangia bacterium]
MRTTAALLTLLMIASSDLSAKPDGKVAKVDGGKKPATADGKNSPPARFRLAAESRDEQKPEERDEPDDAAPPPVLPTDEELTFERPRDLNLLTRDEMLSLAEKYDADIEDDVAHAEAARATAYRSRDVIKLTCIDDKLVQMRLLFNSMVPRFKRLTRVRNDEFSVRAEFIVIAPNWKRSKQLRADVETCIGEMLNDVTVVSVSSEHPDTGGPDPTQPSDPKVNSERPPEASRWR